MVEFLKLSHINILTIRQINKWWCENITLSIILGTRPEIIKMSPVIRECERRGLEHFILHTGQHYSYNMDRVFFEKLGLPEVRYNQEAGSGATCIPGVLTLRDNTGMPETVEAGSNLLAGTEAMIRCARSMLERGSRWKKPLGDGRAGERIVRVIKS